MSEWNWEPDDFAALWLNEGRDCFPRPLHFTSRFRYREEFDAHGREVRARYPDAESAAIELALNTLATADIRLEVSADSGVEDSGNHTRYRIVGPRDLHNAVIAAQTVISGADGPIWVRLGRPENLGKGISTRISPCVPGRHRPDEFHIQDLAPDHTNYFTDTARKSPRERYDRLIDRPLAGSGCAALRIGDFHTRDVPRRVIEWFDFEDDGRCFHRRNSDRIQVGPGTESDLTTILVRWIDKGVQRVYANQDTGGC